MNGPRGETMSLFRQYRSAHLRNTGGQNFQKPEFSGAKKLL